MVPDTRICKVSCTPQVSLTLGMYKYLSTIAEPTATAKSQPKSSPKWAGPSTHVSLQVTL